ncbi:hypothetical protein [Sphingobacterium sp.]|uniref:hypothetical protein n=1 Tax=Sphingobacterium sp. TaxID=341027 RepID=UPI002FDD712B
MMFAPNIGLMNNKVNWAISGDENGQNPNYLSELKWDNYSIQTGIISKVNYGKLGLGLSYSNADSKYGKAVDTDFLGDDRTNINYQEKFSSKNSSYYKYGITPEFRLRHNWFVSMAYIHIKSKNLLNHDTNFSTYTFVQDLLLVGFSWRYIRKKIIWEIGGDFISGKYLADGDWKLRTDLAHPVSFSHKIDIYGGNFSTSLEYVIGESFGVRLDYNLNYIYGNDGKDKMYYSDNYSVDTRLKYTEVIYNSISTAIVYKLK